METLLEHQATRNTRSMSHLAGREIAGYRVIARVVGQIDVIIVLISARASVE